MSDWSYIKLWNRSNAVWDQIQESSAAAAQAPTIVLAPTTFDRINVIDGNAELLAPITRTSPLKGQLTTITVQTANGAQQISIPDADARTRALAEARDVAVWADDIKPEWVRALGALAEVFRGEVMGREFQSRFLEAAKECEEPEIAVAQLEERGHKWAVGLLENPPPPDPHARLYNTMRRYKALRNNPSAPSQILENDLLIMRERYADLGAPAAWPPDLGELADEVFGS